MHQHNRRFAGRKRATDVTLPAFLPATPERASHARSEDALLTVETFSTDAGEKTQLRRHRLVRPLERFWRGGVIDADQYGGAIAYRRVWDMANILGPGATVRYEPRMIDTGVGGFLLPIEKSADYLKKIALAQKSCSGQQRQLLPWIADDLVGWRVEANKHWPGLGEKASYRLFCELLRNTCDALDYHFSRKC